MRLQDSLIEDKALRRFSMISFDVDVKDAVKAVQRQLKLGNVVGLISAHKPDLEFANFDLCELIEIAAQIDADRGFSPETVLHADWSNVASGRAFEIRYLSVSERRADALKGEIWGRALGRFALKHPRGNNPGRNRPILSQISAALHAWNSNYDFERDFVEVDPKTFERRQKDLRTRVGEPAE